MEAKVEQIMDMEQPKNAKKVIERKLDPSWIKQRKGRGNTTLDYLEGARVIQLLNEAFDYKWSFQVVKKQLVQPYGNGRPFIELLGRLTIPGVGVKEAFGSKDLVGDESQCSKAAATDALKKAASLVGVGLELWTDDDLTPPSNNYNNGGNNYNNNQGNQPTNINNKSPQNSQPAQNNQGSQPSWSQPEIVQAANELKQHKQTLGVKKNEDLDAYVKEWSGGDLKSWRDITPANIQTFNQWLANEKVSKLSA